MAISYNHRAIEEKWRREWEEHPINVEGDKKKYYCLDMFPYPSGNGLHVGHWRGYVISDAWSRYKMMQGYYVIHPMGWDAFGLPAENYAIKTGQHPRISTEANIRNIKKQIKRRQASGLPTDFWSLDIPPFTRKYVSRILAFADLLRNHESNSYTLPDTPYREYAVYADVGSADSLEEIAKKADLSLSELRRLNISVSEKTSLKKFNIRRILAPVDDVDRIEKTFGDF